MVNKSFRKLGFEIALHWTTPIFKSHTSTSEKDLGTTETPKGRKHKTIEVPSPRSREEASI